MTQPPKYAQQYFVKDNCLFESGNNKQGSYTKKLCNFVPGATREIMKDDGISFERYVQLGGVHQSGRQLPEITIPAGDVEGLGWIVKYWGMDCILEPGLKTKASVWNAIQSTALDMERITVFATTGWRHVNGNWRYLLPGDEQYTVELPGKMHGYGMERSYNQLDIQTAASLLWQSLAPEEIMLPLLSFTFLSPLNHFLKAAGCEPKFVMLLSGKTGSRKSTLAALMLSFFGKFTASELPLSFRDTANSILLNAFSLKDVLTVIDDLHPSSRMEEPKMNGTAQAIMRAYGDRTGKGRLRADSTPMESRPPQGNAIITAEFAPDIGESGTARYFALELKEKDVDLETLTVFQNEADDGTLQRCMFAYTEWIRESFLFLKNPCRIFRNIFAPGSFSTGISSAKAASSATVESRKPWHSWRSEWNSFCGFSMSGAASLTIGAVEFSKDFRPYSPGWRRNSPTASTRTSPPMCLFTSCFLCWKAKRSAC